MRFILFAFYFVLVAVFGIYPVLATEFSSQNFKILDPVIEPGTGFSTSSGFNLYTTIGQEAIGISTSTTYILKGGFLYFPAPAASTPVAPAGGAGRGTVPIVFKLTEEEKIEALRISDFNSDFKIDIIDLSILLFHYNVTGLAVGRFDLNKNGRVDFPDISILFYYWTALA